MPTLKKEAYEEALYSLTEIGIQEIQPVITQKSRNISSAIDGKEVIRYEKIIIAAAEQSKNFVLPRLLPTFTFDQLIFKLASIQANKIFFDVTGQSIGDLIPKLCTEHKTLPIVAMCGPEGDLTAAEKQLLHQAGFTFCSLTPTVLRSQQAVAIGAGILRAFL